MLKQGPRPTRSEMLPTALPLLPPRRGLCALLLNKQVRQVVERDPTVVAALDGQSLTSEQGRKNLRVARDQKEMISEFIEKQTKRIETLLVESQSASTKKKKDDKALINKDFAELKDAIGAVEQEAGPPDYRSPFMHKKFMSSIVALRVYNNYLEDPRYDVSRFIDKERLEKLKQYAFDIATWREHDIGITPKQVQDVLGGPPMKATKRPDDTESDKKMRSMTKYVIPMIAAAVIAGSAYRYRKQLRGYARAAKERLSDWYHRLRGYKKPSATYDGLAASMAQLQAVGEQYGIDSPDTAAEKEKILTEYPHLDDMTLMWEYSEREQTISVLVCNSHKHLLSLQKRESTREVIHLHI